MTNTREVWCNTVLMGGWRVTQASQGNQPLCHSYGSLQKGAVLPLAWPFGTPDPTLFAGVRGEMAVAMSEAQHSKPDLPWAQAPRSALAAGWTPAPGNPYCSLATLVKAFFTPQPR